MSLKGPDTFIYWIAPTHMPLDYALFLQMDMGRNPFNVDTCVLCYVFYSVMRNILCFLLHME